MQMQMHFQMGQRQRCGGWLSVRLSCQMLFGIRRLEVSRSGDG